ncbi:MAG TPA: dihydrolipoamide acetyltransferase family protein [Steroidobacteraceae bacterium]|nr:dihydrolipoamide acetyltransferase family protein [Steroidobacteraceae bacterium]
MSQRIFPITMPKWGIEMTQGTITAWHAAPGQAVTRGDTLLDVETEKIVNSVEAPVSGTVRRILADVGATENVGALIAVFAAPEVGEAEIDGFIGGFRPADTSFEPDAGSAPAAAPAAAATVAATAASDGSGDGAAKVSPIARRLAEKLGVDITQIKGTGTHGRVSKEDVEAYAARLQGGGTTPATASGPAAATSGTSPATAAQASPASAAAPSRERMTSMRATIARRLLESKQSIPHYRLAADVDLTALTAHRASLNAGGAAKVSINDLIVRAAALALVRHPEVNAQLQGEEILKFAQADVAVAVASENGLVTPIVRAADRKGVAEIAAEVADLAERARGGKLTRDEITGGTFTVSNLGMFGVDRFDAIINPPQVAILAVGAASDRIVARNGQPAVAKVVTLTLSCDHRVVDGATGAKFLGTLRELLETPAQLS